MRGAIVCWKRSVNMRVKNLSKSGEEENIRKKHLKYYLHLLERAEPEFKTPVQIEWNVRLHAERANIRAALEWA